MRSVTDILDEANKAYFRLIDVCELKRQESALAAAAEDKYVYEKNKDRALSLLWRIRAKRLLLEYLQEKCSLQKEEEIQDFAESAAPAARAKGFANTERIILSVAKLAESIGEIISDAPMQAARVRSSDGSPMTSSKAECAEVERIFEEKAQAIADMSVPDPLFNKGVEFIDVKGAVIAELNGAADFARKCAEGIRRREEEELIKEARSLRGVTEWESFPLFPEADLSPAGAAIVLNTPFIDEAELAAVHCLKGTILEVGADKFTGKDELDLSGIFARFAQAGAHVFITDFGRYTGANKLGVIKAASSYAAGGRAAIILDESGDAEIYRTGGGAAQLRRLPLPSREFAEDIFRQEGMLGEGESLPEKYAFMGYVGINLALREHRRGRGWKSALDWLCDEGRSRSAFVFLRKAEKQEYLLPCDWGDFISQAEQKLGGKLPFDYGCLPQDSREAIREIVEKRISLWEKCAKIIEYFYNCQNRRTLWEKKDVSEKREAITAATRAVMQLMGTGIVPDVQFHDDFCFLGKEYDRAIGVCCKDGREILFKNSAAELLDEAADITVHESMHALQAHASKNGWQPWMWEELGVTAGRVESWTYNRGSYTNIGDYWAYRVQIMETDACGFANDCKKYLNISE